MGRTAAGRVSGGIRENPVYLGISVPPLLNVTLWTRGFAAEGKVFAMVLNVWAYVEGQRRPSGTVIWPHTISNRSAPGVRL